MTLQAFRMAIFSRRTSWDRTPTALAECLRKKRAANDRILDLTESNPTRCALALPTRRVASLLDNPHAIVYDPDPRGIAQARQAVAHWYRQRGADIRADSVLLTSGTSEAYWFLMKLLCDSGDEILVPRPSYPLVELLALANDVHLKPYALRYEGEWMMDTASLESQLSSRTRGVIVVHPNNPTGSYVKDAERAWMTARLAQAHVAVIADEVFWSYPQVQPAPASFAQKGGTLTFVLSGLSKVVGLPQLKLSWIVVTGPEALQAEALERLEMLGDLTLSVSMPVQGALVELLEQSDEFARPIKERITRNLSLVRTACGTASGIDVLHLEGGWNVVLRVPQLVSDEQWALMLLDQCGVLVHAGSQFDFSHGAHLVVSLLPESRTLSEGISRLVNWVSSRARS